MPEAQVQNSITQASPDSRSDADPLVGGGKFMLSLFGPLNVRLEGDVPMPRLRTRKGEWLLALLALRGGRPIAREAVAAALWPESDQVQSLYNLRRTLYDLRHALGASASWRIGSPGTGKDIGADAEREREDTRALRLDLSGAADVDVLRFDACVSRGDTASLGMAVDLYCGPLLEGCQDAWILDERSAREEKYLTALEMLARQALARHEPSLAASFLRRALIQDPLRETALRHLLDALATAGDYAAGVLAYRGFRLKLLDELNARPSAETRESYERLKSQMLNVTLPARRAVSAEHIAVTSAPDFEDVAEQSLDPAGGAIPISSMLYIERPSDAAFHRALTRRDSIVLIKGPRQVGKTSLLARGLARVRASGGSRVVVTDLQKLTNPVHHLESADTLLLALARQISMRLGLDVSPERTWDSDLGPSENFERFLRRDVLTPHAEPLIWVLDEVDQLFPYRFAGEIFGLFRSWHNERALEPDGPWANLTLAMAYATEAHLFITDMNQSPFNVGTRLTLEDFGAEAVAEIDKRMGSPLSRQAPGVSGVSLFTSLVGGHPYLVHRGLEVLAGSMRFEDLIMTAVHNDGPFGDHLRRLLHLLRQDPSLCEVLRQFVHGHTLPGIGDFYRLRSAGVLAGEDIVSARPRCGLYARYLMAQLA